MMGSPTLYPYHITASLFQVVNATLLLTAAYWCLLKCWVLFVLLWFLSLLFSWLVMVVEVYGGRGVRWSRCTAVEVIALWILLRDTLDRYSTTKCINSYLWILTLGRMCSGVVLVWETCQVWYMLGLRVCDTCVCISCFSWTLTSKESQPKDCGSAFPMQLLRVLLNYRAPLTLG